MRLALNPAPGCDQAGTYQGIFDALCPDEAVAMRLGIHAARTRQLKQLCVWVDEAFSELLDGDGGRDHDGVGASAGERQEAECAQHGWSYGQS